MDDGNKETEKVRNEEIRANAGVAQMNEKNQETRH